MTNLINAIEEVVEKDTDEIFGKKSTDILNGITETDLYNAFTLAEEIRNQTNDLFPIIEGTITDTNTSKIPTQNLFDRILEQTRLGLEDAKQGKPVNLFDTILTEEKNRAKEETKKVNELKQNKVIQRLDEIDKLLSGSKNPIRKERLIKLADVIDSIPDLDGLVTFLGNYVGEKAVELVSDKSGNLEIQDDSEGNKKIKIKLRFEKQEKWIKEKIDPIINQYLPWIMLVMELYNMAKGVSLDDVVKVVTQMALLQFAPLIEKYNQYSATINEITDITNEINYILNAVETKARQYNVEIDSVLPTIPPIPKLPEIPLSFE